MSGLLGEAQQRLGQDLVGDAIQRVMQILVATAALAELLNYGQAPASTYQRQEAPSEDRTNIVPARMIMDDQLISPSLVRRFCHPRGPQTRR